MHIARNNISQAVVARIMRDAKAYQKTFSRKNYKTWKVAEQEAEKWLAKKKKELPPCRMSETGRMSKRNSSGVVGVNIMRKKRRKKGVTYEYWSWIARWPNCPYTGGLAWGITPELSDDDAFVLAVLAREMQSIDRIKLRKKFNRIQGKKTYDEILSRKKLDLK